MVYQDVIRPRKDVRTYRVNFLLWNACDYFTRLTDSFLPLQEFVNTPDHSTVVKKYRHPEGGSVLFRPIGLQILTEIIAELVEKYPLSKCFKMISKLPTDLTQTPYNGVIWHPTQKKMIIKNKTLVKNLLLCMLNHFWGDVDKLREDYAKAIGSEMEAVELRKKVL